MLFETYENNNDFCIDVLSYGLYEDLYKSNTYSVEDVYEDYWKEKE
jgi:predicted metal-dependent hydrolase